MKYKRYVKNSSTLFLKGGSLYLDIKYLNEAFFMNRLVKKIDVASDVRTSSALHFIEKN